MWRLRELPEGWQLERYRLLGWDLPFHQKDLRKPAAPSTVPIAGLFPSAFLATPPARPSSLSRVSPFSLPSPQSDVGMPRRSVEREQQGLAGTFRLWRPRAVSRSVLSFPERRLWLVSECASYQALTFIKQARDVTPRAIFSGRQNEHSQGWITFVFTFHPWTSTSGEVRSRPSDL